MTFDKLLQADQTGNVEAFTQLLRGNTFTSKQFGELHSQLTNPSCIGLTAVLKHLAAVDEKDTGYFERTKPDLETCIEYALTTGNVEMLAYFVEQTYSTHVSISAQKAATAPLIAIKWVTERKLVDESELLELAIMANNRDAVTYLVERGTKLPSAVGVEFGGDGVMLRYLLDNYSDRKELLRHFSRIVGQLVKHNLGDLLEIVLKNGGYVSTLDYELTTDPKIRGMLLAAMTNFAKRSTYIVVDTETTGLPQNFKAPSSNVSNWPRIVSIAWITPTTTKYYLIKQSKPIPNSHIHGITDEMVERGGRDLKAVLEEFVRDAEKMTFVAHNVSFDINVINCELFRCGMKSLDMPTYCTMEAGKSICKLESPQMSLSSSHQFKYPKLAELAEHFGVTNTNPHNAFEDAKTCLACYERMI